MKYKGQKSNAHCFWTCLQRKINKIIDHSTPQNHLLSDISMWDTLYVTYMELVTYLWQGIDPISTFLDLLPNKDIFFSFRPPLHFGLHQKLRDDLAKPGFLFCSGLTGEVCIRHYISHHQNLYQIYYYSHGMLERL